MTETILIDYLKGLLSNEQRDRVEDWYNQSADNKKKLEDLYFLLFVSDRLNTIESID
ncbi:MAG: anti-sigma factor, partial [Bacteroidales bacterium]|nr:anti-sigma factor [Bacteroidales bacterium]